MFFEFEGSMVYYEYNRAKGIPVLFLHGWGGSTVSFRGLCNSFGAKNRSTVILDFLGHGDSGFPSRQYGAEDFAESVKELLDHLLIDKVQIVAHSFGGRIAIILAAKYPQLVDKMLLTGCAGIKPRRSLCTRLKIFRYKRAKKKGGDLSSFGSKDYQGLSANMRSTFVKVVNQDLSPMLPDIRCETLLVFGSKDRDTPMYMARALKKGIAGSELIVFKGAGHYAYIEEYKRFMLIAESLF